MDYKYCLHNFIEFIVKLSHSKINCLKFLRKFEFHIQFLGQTETKHKKQVCFAVYFFTVCLFQHRAALCQQTDLI